jgi:hypothetical protein
MLVTITLSAACGPKAAPVAPDPGGGGGAAGNDGNDLVATSGLPASADNMCARIFELKRADCDFVREYGLTADECRDEFTRALEDRGPESNRATNQLARCLLDNDSCDAAGACITSLGNPANGTDGPPTDFRTCEQTDVYAPVGLSKADYENRHGAHVTRFRDHASTRETPIEVCGIPAQMDWLLNVTCNDGSHPFRNFDHAHAARVGNVGAAGRCGSIVDEYEVNCEAEGTYRIFIDAYVCPLP